MKIYITALFLLISLILQSQNEMKFERYTADNGLPFNYVVDGVQDSKGFIWFGLRGACCRFDGFTFKTYDIPGPDGKIKAKAWVNKLVLDSKNRLWAGESSTHGQGLLLFDYEKDAFINCYHLINKTNDDFKLVAGSMCAGEDGSIWIGTQKHGTMRYNYDTDKLDVFDVDPKHSISFKKRWNIKTYVQKNGIVWINIQTHLMRYDPRKDQFTSFSIGTGPEDLIPEKIGSIYEDSEGTIWIGLRRGGIFKYKPQNNSLESYFFKSKNNKDLLKCKITSFYEDNQKQLWIGTDHGIWISDKEKSCVYNYTYDEINPQSISSNQISSIIGDNTGNVWLCTSEGISKLKQEKFLSFHYSSRRNSLSNNKVQGLIEDRDHNILIASPAGIDIFYTKSKQFSVWAKMSNDGTGIIKPPMTFERDKLSGLWIGTYDGGLTYYNYSTKKFRYYTKNSESSDSISDDVVFDIAYDEDKNQLWIATGSQGLNMYDIKKNKFIPFKNNMDDPGSIVSDFTRSIYIDYNNNVWVGTIGGLSMLEDIGTGKFRNFNDTTSLLSSKSIIVYDIIDSEKGRYIWIATTLGFFCYDTQTNKLRVYSEKDGLFSNDAYSILKSKNDLWLSSSMGLYKATPDYSKDNIPVMFRFYSKTDGLPGNEFFPSSRCKMENGTMFFGSRKGFTMFHPDSIVDNTISPQLAFTNLVIDNNPVKIGKEINEQVILKNSILTTDSIVLNHKNNKFSVGFVALHFVHPQMNRYKYKLIGFDKDWLEVDPLYRKAEYMNLNGGEYTLKVIGSNSDGVWNNKGIELFIKVLPPWWRTWWFRISVFLVLSISIFGFYRYRLNALKRQKKILEQKVNERTAELRDANSQLEEKQEEILQQNEEILSVNEQLRYKNEEVRTQKEEIESQKEEIESSRDQLEKAFNNITLLSDFGQKLTATFDFDEINKMIHEYVSSLMDTSAFGIGIYNEKRRIIDFPYFMENGEPVPYFFKSLDSEKSLSVKCFINKEEILINNLSQEYPKYLRELPEVQTQNLPASIIHLPLIVKNKAMGTLTVNSIKSRAYNTTDVANLRTLASYISIALDNSMAYRVVSRQKEQITGSIVYGQTIQRAMLPSEEQITQNFENFILFRPKDIVSGDFYWFTSVKNLEGLGSDKLRNPQGLNTGLDSDKLKNLEGFEMEGKPMYFLAVVDCTGHGVPGAFMSMIGSRLLNEIVNEKHIFDTKTILEQMDAMIVRALRQKETQNNDGMDLALVKIIKGDGAYTIEFAGAKRPLLYWTKKDSQIHVIDGTHRSIGGFQFKKEVFDFESNTLTLAPGDAIYLSSDGLVDQCNPQRKKFSSKRLIKTLQEIAGKDMSEQNSILAQSLDDFQGNYHQRDDITLMGIRL